MKLFPEDKPFYKWIFLALFFILLVQYLWIPKIAKIMVYRHLTKSFNSQAVDYEQKAGLHSTL